MKERSVSTAFSHRASGKTSETVPLLVLNPPTEWLAEISDLEEDVKMLFETVISLFLSLLNLGASSIPLRECVEKVHRFHFEVCLGVCAGAYTLELCYSSGEGFAVHSKVGFCGLPKVELDIGEGLVDCH